MSEAKSIHAGAVTLAAGLIGCGVILILANLGWLDSSDLLRKLWPLLLIGVGVEYFIKQALHRDQMVKFHVPSLLLILLAIIAGAIFFTASDVRDQVDWRSRWNIDISAPVPTPPQSGAGSIYML
jgi:hypothetical protein